MKEFSLIDCICIYIYNVYVYRVYERDFDCKRNN